MKRKFIAFSFVLILLTTGLACRAVTRLISPDAPAPLPALDNPTVAPTDVPPSPTAEASCPAETNAIMDDATSGSSGSATNFPNVDTGNSDTILLTTYSVNGDQISDPVYEKVQKNLKSYQKDTALHEQAWQLFTNLIPADQRKIVQEYQVITDGPDNILAAVEQTSSDPNGWVLEVDVADMKDTKNLTFTLIHEFGHLLTLNKSQVPPDIAVFNDPNNDNLYNKEVNACSTYFPGEGCSLPKSYINTFYNDYWTNIYDEWQKIDNIESDTKRQNKLDAFYRKYKDQFVDDYAVTNPSEDIAETWAFFVLNPKPDGNSIADQKISFFYNYPELVQLRQQILQNLCAVHP